MDQSARRAALILLDGELLFLAGVGRAPKAVIAAAGRATRRPP